MKSCQSKSIFHRRDQDRWTLPKRNIHRIFVEDKLLLPKKMISKNRILIKLEKKSLKTNEKDQRWKNLFDSIVARDKKSFFPEFTLQRMFGNICLKTKIAS